MTAHLQRASNGRQSECPTCPSWVIRCAHWDDDSVILSSFELGGGCPCAGPNVGMFAVARTSEMSKCPKDGFLKHGRPLYTGSDYDEANDAFDDAELELLARPVEVCS